MLKNTTCGIISLMGGDKVIRMRLKEILNSKGINITELHERTGISKNTISLMVNDKSKGIQYDTLAKILNATNSKLEDMLEVVNDLYAMYVTGVENDYTPLNNHENRVFRYKVWVDLKGKEELVYDFYFNVLFFKVNDITGNSIHPEKSFLHISFVDQSIECANHELAVKFNSNVNKTVINVISYLVVTDLLFQMDLSKKDVPNLAYFDWIRFERDNVHQTSINVPITFSEKNLNFNEFKKNRDKYKKIANFNYLQHCFPEVEDYHFEKETGKTTVFFLYN